MKIYKIAGSGEHRLINNEFTKRVLDKLMERDIRIASVNNYQIEVTGWKISGKVPMDFRFEVFDSGEFVIDVYKMKKEPGYSGQRGSIVTGHGETAEFAVNDADRKLQERYRPKPR